ncbi:MAG TPA: hypothetical protein VL572_08035 [Pyrinomonadaceae bacterium]|nr:hypothetical protein [Pyrinomonadaceae bacterium]
MEKYRNLFKWMIIPMIIMQLGIFMDYWGDFSENAWSVHIHYWTGTVWYFFLIIQPYFATHGQIARHRTFGIVGMFLAGGVCLTALSMLNRDMVTAERSLALPERFGPFQPWFFYGVAAVEIVMMTAFGYAVIRSIIHRKQMEDHAWWLVSTVFLIMMPALARGVQLAHVRLTYGDRPGPEADIMTSLYVTQLVILGMVAFAAWKYGKLRHPATYLAVAVNVFIFLLEPIGRNEGVQAFLRTVIKG